MVVAEIHLLKKNDQISVAINQKKNQLLLVENQAKSKQYSPDTIVVKDSFSILFETIK